MTTAHHCLLPEYSYVNLRCPTATRPIPTTFRNCIKLQIADFGLAVKPIVEGDAVAGLRGLNGHLRSLLGGRIGRAPEDMARGYRVLTARSRASGSSRSA